MPKIAETKAAISQTVSVLDLCDDNNQQHRAVQCELEYIYCIVSNKNIVSWSVLKGYSIVSFVTVVIQTTTITTTTKNKNKLIIIIKK